MKLTLKSFQDALQKREAGLSSLKTGKGDKPFFSARTRHEPEATEACAPTNLKCNDSDDSLRTSPVADEITLAREARKIQRR